MCSQPHLITDKLVFSSAALSDFHYGSISIECAESLCSEPGEFLIRNGGISENDLRLTVKKRSRHAHFSIYKDQHVSWLV